MAGVGAMNNGTTRRCNRPPTACALVVRSFLASSRRSGFRRRVSLVVVFPDLFWRWNGKLLFGVGKANCKRVDQSTLMAARTYGVGRRSTQQIIAGDCLQLRSFLTALPAAPEFGRSASARNLAGANL
jgi:hypothetical protein